MIPLGVKEYLSKKGFIWLQLLESIEQERDFVEVFYTPPFPCFVLF